MHTMKIHVGVDMQCHPFMTLTPVGVSGQLQDVATLSTEKNSPSIQ
jgi:TPP-dependent indolepyruvate ferredoxin oxidoreductase alpha subunit